MVKISVVVPIYNAEEYLNECISSIINQSFRNIEIILVNDGSTDKSSQICNEYAKDDKRIKIINKSNGGLVSARKAGVKMATGEYVTFVDADDFIEEDTLGKMYSWVIKCYPDADVIACAFKQDYGTWLDIKKNGLENGIYKGEKLEILYDRIMNYGKFYTFAMFPSLCLKLFRRQLLTKYQIQIPDDITMGEDAGVTFPVIFNCDCMVIDNDITGYHYRVVSNSMSRQLEPEPRYFEQISNLYVYMKSELSKKENASIDRQLQNYRLYLVGLGMRRLKESSYTRRERIDYIEKRVRGTAVFDGIDKSDLSNYPDKTYLWLTAKGRYFVLDLIEGVKVVKKFLYKELVKIKKEVISQEKC